jgi:hypothetical protein
VLACLAVLATLLVAPAVPHPQQRAAGATPATVAPDQRSALAAARAAGRSVEVLADRTESSQTFANPSGTLTLKETAVPVRARQADGSWAPIDTTLRPRTDGTVAPAAALAGVAFSAGGAGPMATMRSGAATLSFWWPASLPAPALSGETATYRELLPGVDLQLRATAVGFSQLLVVKTAAAAASPALGALRLPMRTSGATLSADASGAVSGVDETGRRVFRTPASSMWDSGARHAAVAVTVGDDALDLRPDPSFLADPSIRYPVYIDPTWVGWTGLQQGWTKVSANFPNQTYWDGHNDPDPQDFGEVKVGRAPVDSGDDTLWRSYFQLDTARIDGKRIDTATFTAWETWSVSCRAKDVELDLVTEIDPSTDWMSRPSPVSTLFNGSQNAYGHDSGCPGPHELDFDVRSAVEQAADSSWPNVTLALRAPDEGTCYANANQDTCEWRKFDSGSIVGQHAPSLSITYDTPPDTPSGIYVEGSQYLYPGGQVPCDGQTHSVSTTQPVVHAYLSDPDEVYVAQPLTLIVNWSTYDSSGTQVGSGQTFSTAINGNGWAQLTLPAGQVSSGGSVHLDAHANDGIKDSPSTTNCILAVDTTPQSRPPGVKSADGKFPCTGAMKNPPGTSGRFELTPPDTTPPSFGDVAGFLYGMNTPPWKLVTASPTDGTATVTAAPPYFGTDDLQVQVIGSSGILGPIADCTIGTSHPTSPTVVAQWNLDETGGSTAHDSVGGHDLALSAGPGTWSWTTAGHTNGALHLGGGAVAAGTEPAVDTQYGFTVSAWVDLDSLDGGGTVVTGDGTNSPAFYLRYSHFQNRWLFGMSTSDTSGATVTTAVSDGPPVAGTWTHLVGVYCDSTACGATGTNPGVMELYVGVGNSPPQLQSSQPAFDTPWRTTAGVHLGAVQAGPGSYMDFLNGSVDDVSLYWADPCPPPAVSSACSIP